MVDIIVTFISLDDVSVWCIWCICYYIFDFMLAVCVLCAQLLQSCPPLCNLWTVTCQALLSMGFSRQKYWSWLPCPSPGNLSNSGIELGSLALAVPSLPLSHQGSHMVQIKDLILQIFRVFLNIHCFIYIQYLLPQIIIIYWQFICKMFSFYCPFWKTITQYLNSVF